jgi:hypothetical protein
MSAQGRQDDLLEQLVAADDAASDTFFTASTMDGTTLLHHGLPNGGQIEVGPGDVKALAARGLVTIMEYRQYGDVAFVLSPQARAYAERRRTGTTALEAERARADRAEEALRTQERADAEREVAEEDRRRRMANRIAWIPAAALALIVGYILFLLTETPELRTIAGIFLAAGVAGSWAFGPTRAFGARLLIPILRWIHGHT